MPAGEKGKGNEMRELRRSRAELSAKSPDEAAVDGWLGGSSAATDGRWNSRDEDEPAEAATDEADDEDEAKEEENEADDDEADEEAEGAAATAAVSWLGLMGCRMGV